MLSLILAQSQFDAYCLILGESKLFNNWFAYPPLYHDLLESLVFWSYDLVIYEKRVKDNPAENQYLPSIFNFEFKHVYF